APGQGDARHQCRAVAHHRDLDREASPCSHRAGSVENKACGRGVLDGEAGRLVQGDLVVGATTRLLLREDLADLGDMLRVESLQHATTSAPRTASSKDSTARACRLRLARSLARSALREAMRISLKSRMRGKVSRCANPCTPAPRIARTRASSRASTRAATAAVPPVRIAVM